MPDELPPDPTFNVSESEAIMRTAHAFANFGVSVAQATKNMTEFARSYRFWQSIDRDRGKRDLE